jgi:hypothetical protein
MTTQHIAIPIELFAQLEAKAQAVGKTVDKLASEALRESLGKEPFETKATRWRDKYGKKPGYTPEQVPDVVREWRHEQRGR